jgi:sodium/potassium-transporting ATPase subunit alpha
LHIFTKEFLSLADVQKNMTFRALDILQAAKRLEANGPNVLTPPKGRPEWLKYVLQYTNPLLALLIIAGVLTFVAYGLDSDPRDRSNIILAVILFGTIFVLGTTQYWNERAAGSVAAKLRSLLPSNALVRRGNQEFSIPAADLVVGDIVHMTIGTRVSADLKIIQSSDLKLDFSSLTGDPLFSHLLCLEAQMC